MEFSDSLFADKFTNCKLISRISHRFYSTDKDRIKVSSGWHHRFRKSYNLLKDPRDNKDTEGRNPGTKSAPHYCFGTNPISLQRLATGLKVLKF